MPDTKKSTALATAETFSLVNSADAMDPELAAELADELEDLDPESGIVCRQIKIPAGGMLSYVIQGEDENDEDQAKEIRAVVVFTHRANGYWPEKFGSGDSQNAPPYCSSMDGKTGLITDTGEVRSCETCPFNEYGSGIDQQGNASRGKACKNMRRLYLMMDGDPNLYLLTVPPTSIKDVNRQMAKIIAGGTPYVGLVVSLTLEKTKNASGVAYSKVVIKKAGKLPPAVMAQAMALRRKIKDQYSNVALTMDDYAPAQTDPNKPQFTETDAAATGDLPFADAPAKEAEAPHPAEPELPFT